MSMNETQDPRREAILAAAAKLSGTVPVEKGLEPTVTVPVTPEVVTPETQPVEKSVSLTETELTSIVEKAVNLGFEKAVSLIDERLAPISKSLESIQGDTSATLTFQGAAVAVLQNFKDNGDQLATQVGVLSEVTKAIQTDVTAIGDQPAVPRSVVGAAHIEKGVPQTADKPEIDMAKVMEIAKGMDLNDAVDLKVYAKQGNVEGLRNMLKPSQRAALGLQ